MIRAAGLYLIVVAALAAWQAGTLPLLIAQLVAAAGLMGATAALIRSES